MHWSERGLPGQRHGAALRLTCQRADLPAHTPALPLVVSIDAVLVSPSGYIPEGADPNLNFTPETPTL